jgi:hypothetical protein
MRVKTLCQDSGLLLIKKKNISSIGVIDNVNPFHTRSVTASSLLFPFCHSQTCALSIKKMGEEKGGMHIAVDSTSQRCAAVAVGNLSMLSPPWDIVVRSH